MFQDHWCYKITCVTRSLVFQLLDKLSLVKSFSPYALGTWQFGNLALPEGGIGIYCVGVYNCVALYYSTAVVAVLTVAVLTVKKTLCIL